MYRPKDSIDSIFAPCRSEKGMNLAPFGNRVGLLKEIRKRFNIFVISIAKNKNHWGE